MKSKKFDASFGFSSNKRKKNKAPVLKCVFTFTRNNRRENIKSRDQKGDSFLEKRRVGSGEFNGCYHGSSALPCDGYSRTTRNDECRLIIEARG